jgi:hypothetical protein
MPVELLLQRPRLLLRLLLLQLLQLQHRHHPLEEQDTEVGRRQWPLELHLHWRRQRLLVALRLLLRPLEVTGVELPPERPSRAHNTAPCSNRISVELLLEDSRRSMKFRWYF